MIINHSACRPATMQTALPLFLKSQGKQIQEREHVRYGCWDIGSVGAKSPSFLGVCMCSYCIQFTNDAAFQPRRMVVTAYTLLLDNSRVF